MKKIIVLGLLLLSAAFTYAQGIQLGIRAGVNNGTMSTKIPNIVEGPVQNGLLVGAFGRVSLLGFFVQPEVNYSTRKARFEQVYTGQFTNTLNYIDINAMFGYSLIGVLRVNVGPTLMTLVSASQNGDASMKDDSYSKDFYEASAWGFQAGVGFDLGKLCIDLRYDTNLTNMGKKNINSTRFGNPTDYSTGYSMYTFSLGYKIFKL